MLSQMLPVHGSIEKYFREKILQIPRVLAVLISRLCTADSAILVVFRGSLLLYYTLLVEYCCTSSISGICTAGTAKYWQYFVRLVLREMVLRVLRVLGVLTVPKYFQYSQYTGSMKYISTVYLCTAVSKILSPFYCRAHSLFTDVPTNGS